MRVFFAPYSRPIARMMKHWEEAKTSIHIVTFLFGHWEAMELLLSLKDRVEIKLIVDHKVSGQPQSLARTMAKRGLEVRKLKVSYGYMHSKYQIIDDSILLIGSANISPDADKINHEFVLETRDQDLITSFRANFQLLYKNSEPIVPKRLFFFWR